MDRRCLCQRSPGWNRPGGIQLVGCRRILHIQTFVISFDERNGFFTPGHPACRWMILPGLNPGKDRSNSRTPSFCAFRSNPACACPQLTGAICGGVGKGVSRSAALSGSPSLNGLNKLSCNRLKRKRWRGSNRFKLAQRSDWPARENWIFIARGGALCGGQAQNGQSHQRRQRATFKA